jgi:hypothetical protein
MKTFKVTYNPFTVAGFTRHLTISALDENHAYFRLIEILSNNVSHSSKYYMSFINVDDQLLIIPGNVNIEHIDKFSIHEITL